MAIDTTQSILRSAGRFFSGTMLSRVSGMLRDMAMAYAFGTQSAVAALLVAFRFAHMLRRLFGEGALQTAFIPHFEGLRKEDPGKASRFFQDLAKSLSVFLIVLISAILLGLYALEHFVNWSPGNLEILRLTELMMPSLLFICLFGINAALLQCEKAYFIVSVAPIAFNVVWIVGVFYVSSLPHEAAMSWLAGFIVLACFAQWAMTLPKTWSILKKEQSLSNEKRHTWFSRDVRSLIKPLSLGMIGVAASQVNNALDAVFARMADAEGPAFLWYAIRLQQLPLALFGIALSGALLPPLSRALANHDKAAYQKFLTFALENTLLLMLPLTAVLFVMGDRVIHLIYGYGDFTSASIVATTEVLWGYAFGLIPMALILVVAPAFYATGDYRTPAMASTGSMMMNILLNTVLVCLLGWGAAAVAVATSLSAWLNYFWLSHFLSKRTGERPFAQLIPQMAGVMLATALASFAYVAQEAAIWGQVTGWLIATNSTPQYSVGVVAALLHVLFGALTFGGVFFGMILVLKEVSKKMRMRQV